MAVAESNASRSGCLRAVLLTGLAVVLGCCGLPALFLRPDVDVNTFYPEKGTTIEDMRAKHGPPSEAYTNPDGTATWFYSTGRFGLGGAIGVNFDASGRVESSFNH